MQAASRAFVRALIIGPPGSGKGTISSRIVRDFGFKYLSSGDLLRAQMEKGTGAGMAAKECIAQGKLVGDDVMVDLIIGELEQMGKVSYLLDGFPRTVGQAKALDSRQPIDFAINLNVPFTTIQERIQHRWVHAPSGRVYHTQYNPPKSPGVDDITGEALIQRPDDKPEAVAQRLELYRQQTAPVLEHYLSQKKLHEFSGTESNVIYPMVHQFLSTKVTPLSKL